MDLTNVEVEMNTVLIVAKQNTDIGYVYANCRLRDEDFKKERYVTQILTHMQQSLSDAYELNKTGTIARLKGSSIDE